MISVFQPRLTLTRLTGGTISALCTCPASSYKSPSFHCGDLCNSFLCWFFFVVVSKSLQRWTNIRHNQTLRSEVAVLFSTGDNEQKGRDSSPVCACVCVNSVFVVNLKLIKPLNMIKWWKCNEKKLQIFV